MTETIWTATTIPPRAIRYGVDAPLPERRDLRAGPLTAVLEGGDLRYVRLGDELVALRIYGAIRDRNWGTIEPAYSEYAVDERDDGFTVTFTAENVSPDVDFVWRGTIAGSADGTIVCDFDGSARRDFARNRIGWCLLHPMGAAGLPATVETPGGTVEGRFPDLISPHQPFLDMEALTHPTRNGGEVTFRFSGDLFETEDQRNWTDASFKTYSTPLRIPYPVELKAGDTVRQTVTIVARGGAPATAATGGPVTVTVGPGDGAPLPPIGLVAAGHGHPLSTEQLDRLNELRLGHLRIELDLAADAWRERLERAGSEAAALGAPLEVAALTGDAGEGLAALCDALRGLASPVARLLTFPASGMTTTEPVAREAQRVRDALGLGLPVGGGSRAFFTELNRATLPLDQLEVVAYPFDPTVHAIDNASIVETIPAQAETVRSARAIVGDRPLAVGPVTLRMPFNPNATGPEPKPAPGTLPSAVDARQPSLFNAGYTAGTIASVAAAGADAITFCETTGWKGVMERTDHPLRVAAFHSWPGMVFPIWHVLADAAAFRGGRVRPVEVSDTLRATALALGEGERTRVVVASFEDADLSVTLSVPGATSARVRMLDETTFAAACGDPEPWRAASSPVAVEDGALSLVLRPFGVATIDLG